MIALPCSINCSSLAELTQFFCSPYSYHFSAFLFPLHLHQLPSQNLQGNGSDETCHGDCIAIFFFFFFETSSLSSGFSAAGFFLTNFLLLYHSLLCSHFFPFLVTKWTGRINFLSLPQTCVLLLFRGACLMCLPSVNVGHPRRGRRVGCCSLPASRTVPKS